jgi:hypothetical protein
MRDVEFAHSNVFDVKETAVLRVAFELAWERLCASTGDSELAKNRLANALMVIASGGESDPDILAERALIHCSRQGQRRLF